MTQLDVVYGVYITSNSEDMNISEFKYAYISIVFTCLTLHLFPYPVPTGDQGSIQCLTLWHVPVDVLAKMFTLFSTVKELKCQRICPAQVCARVQCDLGCTSLLYQSQTVF